MTHDRQEDPMKVRYDGPTGAVNRDVGRATGLGDTLTRGATYEVPAELGERLMRQAGWTPTTTTGRHPPVIYNPPAEHPTGNPQAEAPSPPADDPKEV